jgi:uncharacterized membrane protein YfcA
MDLMLSVGGVEVAIVWLAALGATVGLIAGMFGVGGGFLLIPLLHVVLNVPLPIAIGSGLCQTIASSLGSLLRYRKLGHAETRLDLLLLGGSIPGVTLGTMILQALTGMGSLTIGGKEIPLIQVIVSISFLFVFFSVSLMLWFKAPASSDDSIKPGPLSRIRVPPLVSFPIAELKDISAPLTCYIGLALGTLSGLLGIGGGVILMPIMLYGFGFNIRKAAGTGIVVILVVSTIGTVQHARLGHVHLGLAMILMIGSASAAQVGASLTQHLPARTLRRGLALIIVAANIAFAYKVFG